MIVLVVLAVLAVWTVSSLGITKTIKIDGYEFLGFSGTINELGFMEVQVSAPEGGSINAVQFCAPATMLSSVLSNGSFSAKYRIDPETMSMASSYLQGSVDLDINVGTTFKMVNVSGDGGSVEATITTEELFSENDLMVMLFELSLNGALLEYLDNTPEPEQKSKPDYDVCSILKHLGDGRYCIGVSNTGHGPLPGGRVEIEVKFGYEKWNSSWPDFHRGTILRKTQQVDELEPGETALFMFSLDPGAVLITQEPFQEFLADRGAWNREYPEPIPVMNGNGEIAVDPNGNNLVYYPEDCIVVIFQWSGVQREVLFAFLELKPGFGEPIPNPRAEYIQWYIEQHGDG